MKNTPFDLSAEWRVDPVGMDVENPRFSWKLPDGGARDVAQVAYRIRVATSAERLAAPDCWDSGEVESARSLDIEYAGRPLEPSTEYFWTVETLDNHGQRAVSAPARWRTGLLRPENWLAKWITVNQATLEEYDLHGAGWMEVGKDGETVFAFDAEPGDIDPHAAELNYTGRAWRPSLNVSKAKTAILACAATGAFEIEINGKPPMKFAAGHVLRFVDVAGLLDEARNEIHVLVKDGGAFLATLSLPGGRVLATKCDGPPGDRALPFRTVEKFSPAFRKTFRTEKSVRDAVLHISGLGFYEASIDGRRIGAKVLDPAPTDYDDRVLYSTYEIGDMLSAPGEHTMDVLVGRGAYDTHAQDVWNIDEAPWRATPCLIAQLEIRYADGSTDRVVTDGSWRQVGSPVVWDDLREGEIHAPGLAPLIDLPAAVTAGPAGRLEAMPLPGAEKVETWKPASFARLTDGPGPTHLNSPRSPPAPHRGCFLCGLRASQSLKRFSQSAT